MSLLAVILSSLSSSMIQPTSSWPFFTPSTTTTPTPSPSSCTTKWIIHHLTTREADILATCPAATGFEACDSANQAEEFRRPLREADAFGLLHGGFDGVEPVRSPRQYLQGVAGAGSREHLPRIFL